MSARKSWSQLTPAYRARLEARGITAATHASADKTSARGHVRRLPGQIDPELYRRVVNAEATPRELKTLPSQFTWPDWVPRTVNRQDSRGRRYPFKTSPDVAAALSQLPNPKHWKSVEFVPRGDGQPWTMIVKMKGYRYDREIEIPGGGGPGTGAKEMLEIVTEFVEKSEEKRKRREAESLFIDVMGSA